MAQNMNQFAQTRQVGQLDLQVGQNPSVFTMRIDPDSAGADIVPGTGVLLKDGGANDPGGLPLVDIRAADTDAIFGVIIYGTKQNTYQPGDVVEVASYGSVIVLEAPGALSRGAEVTLNVAAAGEIQAVTTNTKAGILLDKAAADGDLVRVKLEQ